jgi:hypothetical protein
MFGNLRKQNHTERKKNQGNKGLIWLYLKGGYSSPMTTDQEVGSSNLPGRAIFSMAYQNLDYETLFRGRAV